MDFKVRRRNVRAQPSTVVPYAPPHRVHVSLRSFGGDQNSDPAIGFQIKAFLKKRHRKG